MVWPKRRVAPTSSSETRLSLVFPAFDSRTSGHPLHRRSVYLSRLMWCNIFQYTRILSHSIGYR